MLVNSYTRVNCVVFILVDLSFKVARCLLGLCK